MLKRLLIIFMSMALMFILVGCGGSSNTQDEEQDTKEVTEEIDLDSLIKKVQSLNFQLYDKFQQESVSNEDKVAEANRIEQEIQSDYDTLQQRNKEDNEDTSDFDYAELNVYEAYGALRAECNEIREYIESGDPEDLEDINKYHDAVLDDIQNYQKQANKE